MSNIAIKTVPTFEPDKALVDAIKQAIAKNKLCFQHYLHSSFVYIKIKITYINDVKPSELWLKSYFYLYPENKEMEIYKIAPYGYVGIVVDLA